jgi:MSHA biogenesis protein MshM
MYYAFFGLKQPPFRITPDTDFFFEGGNRGAVLEALTYAITQGEGIVKVTGEVGSGKTMLCRMLATMLPDHVETVYLANPSLSPEDILHAIAFELQLPLPPGSSRLEAIHAIHQYLLERHSENKHVVLLVEEAQGMPLESLEQIRLLTNLETEQDKLLQIVLFGQPELNEHLIQPNIRQLKDRITHSFSLDPLSPNDIRAYLAFRLRAAGYKGPDLFGPAVIRVIAKHSKGLTRRINIIADKTLLAAFAESTHTITPRHARIAVRDSEFASHIRLPGRKISITVALATAAAALGGLAHLYAEQHQQQPAKVSQPSQPLAAPAGENPSPAPSSLVIHPAAEAHSDADIVKTRLAATELWLATGSGETLTIQLMGTNDEEQLRTFLTEIGQIIEIGKVFVYRTKARGNPSLTVVYGSFVDRKQALDALANLPAQLKASHPILRSINGIRAEIQAVTRK